MVRMLWILPLLLTGSAWSAPHPACVDVAYDYQTHTPEELRIIAASCDRPAWARLNYNRAYHQDLLKEARLLGSLVQLHDRESIQTRMEAHRLYIAMVEAMAARLGRFDTRMVEALNSVYDRQDEIATHRLKGREPLARKLEQG